MAKRMVAFDLSTCDITHRHTQHDAQSPMTTDGSRCVPNQKPIANCRLPTAGPTKRQLSHFETATTLQLNGCKLFKGKVEEQAIIFRCVTVTHVCPARNRRAERSM